MKIRKKPNVEIANNMLLLLRNGAWYSDPRLADLQKKIRFDRFSVPVFVKAALKEPNQHARNYAQSLLGNIGKPAIPLLAKALSDPDVQIRCHAVECLGGVGGSIKKSDIVVPYLADALKDDDSRVRLRAVSTLGSLQDHIVNKLINPAKKNMPIDRAVSPDKSIVGALRKALYDKNEAVRREAHYWLHEFPGSAVPKRLISEE